jgi:hypothetical protein
MEDTMKIVDVRAVQPETPEAPPDWRTWLVGPAQPTRLALPWRQRTISIRLNGSASGTPTFLPISA